MFHSVNYGPVRSPCHVHHHHPRPSFGFGNIFGRAHAPSVHIHHVPRINVQMSNTAAFFTLTTMLAIKALAVGILGVATVNPVAAIGGFSIFGLSAAAIAIGAFCCLNE